MTRPWPYPHIVAHRGGGSLAPENTLAAIDVGARHGHKMIEFDAKLAQDGQIFLLHDDTLDRTSNGWGVAGELPWDKLVQLDAGNWYSSAFKGERLPLLSEVAERCREHGLMANIEIKPTTGSDDETGWWRWRRGCCGKGRPTRCSPPSRWKHWRRRNAPCRICRAACCWRTGTTTGAS